LRCYLSPAAALVSALLIAMPSVAKDLQKSGALRMKSTSTGSYRFFGIGDGASHLDLSENTGKIVGEGLLNGMTTHCFDVGETVKSVSETPHGHCVDRDADGDQIVYRTAFEKSSWSSTKLRGSGIAMLGTGKYEGIVSSYTLACEVTGPEAGYTMECDGQGTYILPRADH
jgi:hypothetical protein